MPIDAMVNASQGFVQGYLQMWQLAQQEKRYNQENERLIRKDAAEQNYRNSQLLFSAAKLDQGDRKLAYEKTKDENDAKATADWRATQDANSDATLAQTKEWNKTQDDNADAARQQAKELAEKAAQADQDKWGPPTDVWDPKLGALVKVQIKQNGEQRIVGSLQPESEKTSSKQIATIGNETTIVNKATGTVTPIGDAAVTGNSSGGKFTTDYLNSRFSTDRIYFQPAKDGNVVQMAENEFKAYFDAGVKSGASVQEMQGGFAKIAAQFARGSGISILPDQLSTPLNFSQREASVLRQKFPKDMAHLDSALEVIKTKPKKQQAELTAAAIKYVRDKAAGQGTETEKTPAPTKAPKESKGFLSTMSPHNPANPNYQKPKSGVTAKSGTSTAATFNDKRFLRREGPQ